MSRQLEESVTEQTKVNVIPQHVRKKNRRIQWLVFESQDDKEKTRNRILDALNGESVFIKGSFLKVLKWEMSWLCGM